VFAFETNLAETEGVIRAFEIKIEARALQNREENKRKKIPLIKANTTVPLRKLQLMLTLEDAS
jgi:hypothetical protein